MKAFEEQALGWIHPPKHSQVTPGKIVIETDPGTDFWQRTYYGFRNDNAHGLLCAVEGDFSFTAMTRFDSKVRFDQCGILLYEDSDNWAKASIEFENDAFQRLGSVVTNRGYSDWATTDIPASVKAMSYRLSRRGMDFCFECAGEGEPFKQMRIFHFWAGEGPVHVGLYACSPGQSRFHAEFTGMRLEPCLWEAHEA